MWFLRNIDCGSMFVMTERDEEAGGRGKQQDSGKPKGEVTGHGQADKAKARGRTWAELLKISLYQHLCVVMNFRAV